MRRRLDADLLMTHTTLAVFVAAPRVDVTVACESEHVAPPRPDRRNVLPAQRGHGFWGPVVVDRLIASAQSTEFTLAPGVDLALVYRLGVSISIEVLSATCSRTTQESKGVLRTSDVGEVNRVLVEHCGAVVTNHSCAIRVAQEPKRIDVLLA